MAAGAEEVLVIDGHGPGGIRFGGPAPAGKATHGRPLALQALRESLREQYDVSVIIGQHAMAGVADGDLAHTQSSRAIDR